MWFHGRFPVNRLSDRLINDKVNKYSAYYHFGSNPILQNGLILKAVRLLFGDNHAPSPIRDEHTSFNGV